SENVPEGLGNCADPAIIIVDFRNFLREIIIIIRTQPAVIVFENYLSSCPEVVPIAKTGSLSKETRREAVIEGALLRLRPKVMTVATIVAGLLPIMWTTKTGAEVMKPLATAVLGGMI